MNGSWYPVVIVFTFSAVLTLQSELKLTSLVPAARLSQLRKSAPETVSPVQGGALPEATLASGQRSPADRTDKRSPTAGEPKAPAPDSSPEAVAGRNYQRAVELANQAVKAYSDASEAANGAASEAQAIALIRRERFLWQASLQKLAAIPQSSSLYDRAANKQAQYQQLLDTAEDKLAKADGAFLTDIIKATGTDPQSVHITLCQIDSSALWQPGQISSQRCRHHQGDQRMASAASMIKVPIALVLMHKVATEGIDFSQKIRIDPGNFTEDADGTKIEVGQEYPLREVMGRMIDQSNNVATNQLIDYLGRSYIEQVLKEKGYADTYAGHKLAGDRIMPADAGTIGNYSTSHNITAMMVQIYRQETPEDEQILKALMSQTDRELGYEALKDMGPAILWLGEKTGQNKRALATTLAMKVGEERYVLTVALNYSSDAYALRQIVQGTAAHLLETGPIIARPRR